MKHQKHTKEITTANLYRIIEALMERNEILETENRKLKKEAANQKMAAPSPIVLRALAIFGD
jgi:hypothetical protein